MAGENMLAEAVSESVANGDGFGLVPLSGLLKQALSDGYRFARLDGPEAVDAAGGGAPTCFLRHDVDISPPAALRIGRMQADLGIQASYFFQLNAETYPFFADSTLGTIRDLRALGHCVGLHIDERLVGDDPDAVRDTVEWVAARVVPIDRAVSFHRPSPAVLARRFPDLMNAYDDRVFHPDAYLSDSRRSLAFLPTWQAWTMARRPRLQLLLHPEWWGEADGPLAVWQGVLARRTADLQHYMASNFSKVFKGIVEMPKPSQHPI